MLDADLLSKFAIIITFDLLSNLIMFNTFCKFSYWFLLYIC